MGKEEINLSLFSCDIVNVENPKTVLKYSIEKKKGRQY